MMSVHTFALGDAEHAPLVPEPPRAFWRDLTSYDEALLHGLIAPLIAAERANGRAPQWLQLAVLRHLQWYFTVDARPRAPTVALQGPGVAVFHGRVADLLQHIDSAVIDALDPAEAAPEIRQALHSYHAVPHCSGAVLDAVDHARALARLTYYVFGEPPVETLFVDGIRCAPVFSKYRACNYFGRQLMRQRIAWVPVAGATRCELKVGDARMPIGLGAQPSQTLADNAVLAAALLAYPPGKGDQHPLPLGLAGWKARATKLLARSPLASRFTDAWVFVDREIGADDSAEHLYRWVREHRPDVNAWFLLSPDARDWQRLQAEGFRLVGPGLTRKLLLLNAKHIISSHAQLIHGGFDRHLYGDAMQWHYTFLQHGAITSDLSHWLNGCDFDMFVASSPAENDALVGDDTPYIFTKREVALTGLPRHDRLLRIANGLDRTQVDALLVMPTWRGGLFDPRTHTDNESRLAAIAASPYIQHWGALLRSEELRDLAAAHGTRIVFMPHHDAVPYIEAFQVPDHVEVVIPENGVFQHVFARSAALITDFSSVASEMAFLRRAMFYYHFDRDRFYSGDHNWRKGYFDHDSDGFGPVAFNHTAMIAELRQYFADGCRPQPLYLERMERAMPYRDT
ncbi:MAG TPA: CDP-glycerol glycerophosphotransferase family protein, partial [Telluria sp.]|nr:CDP-glycerol glycerophosphotransferase family protein [Telluria sp.]